MLGTNIEKGRQCHGDLSSVCRLNLQFQINIRRMAFSEWSQNNEVSFNNVWFSDEAQFNLDGEVNKQNVLSLVVYCFRL
jgi:hypothetical protein